MQNHAKLDRRVSESKERGKPCGSWVRRRTCWTWTHISWTGDGIRLRIRWNWWLAKLRLGLICIDLLMLIDVSCKLLAAHLLVPSAKSQHLARPDTVNMPVQFDQARDITGCYCHSESFWVTCVIFPYFSFGALGWNRFRHVASTDSTCHHTTWWTENGDS